MQAKKLRHEVANLPNENPQDAILRERGKPTRCNLAGEGGNYELGITNFWKEWHTDDTDGTDKGG